MVLAVLTVTPDEAKGSPIFRKIGLSASLKKGLRPHIGQPGGPVVCRRKTLKQLSDGVPATVDQCIAGRPADCSPDRSSAEPNLLSGHIHRHRQPWIGLDCGRNRRKVLPAQGQAGDSQGRAVAKEDLGKALGEDGLEAML